MKNWKGTKEKVFGLQFANLIFIQDEDYYGANNILDIDQVGEKVVKENQRLIIDAFDTIQKCDLLPSELLNQRDELLSMLKQVTPWMDKQKAENLYNNSRELINRINPNK